MKLNLFLLVISLLAVLLALTPEAEAAGGSIRCDCHCYFQAVARYKRCRNEHKTKTYCRSYSGISKCGTGCSVNACDDSHAASPFR
ncbi:hypothetical protein BJV82DRAFT_633733 [Fennellomyces sp. T-0311]|nr:hypothetical protein BJV82DRAFT_633733 [Fennellomyces sp. T-0311]